MPKFIPTFFIRNRQGMFLAHHDRTGANKMPVKWVRNRTDAESFSRWIDADNFAIKLLNLRDTAQIVDQIGDIWTAGHAQNENVFHSITLEQKA